MTAELCQPLVLLTALAQGNSIDGESRLRVPWQTNQFDSQLSIATRTALAAGTGADRQLMLAALTLAAPDNAAQQVSAAGETIDDADWLAAANFVATVAGPEDPLPLLLAVAGKRGCWPSQGCARPDPDHVEDRQGGRPDRTERSGPRERLAASARINAAGAVNLVRSSVAGMIGGLISVGGGLG